MTRSFEERVPAAPTGIQARGAHLGTSSCSRTPARARAPGGGGGPYAHIGAPGLGGPRTRDTPLGPPTPCGTLVPSPALRSQPTGSGGGWRAPSWREIAARSGRADLGANGEPLGGWTRAQRSRRRGRALGTGLAVVFYSECCHRLLPLEPRQSPLAAPFTPTPRPRPQAVSNAGAGDHGRLGTAALAQ